MSLYYSKASVVSPSSVRRPSTFSNILSSETTGPIEAKFYMKVQWDTGNEILFGHLGHMTKMAATPIYGEKPSKIFFSGPCGLIAMKFGIKHLGCKAIIFHSNYDQG